LLIEEARTNLSLYSEDLTNVSWNKTGATISSNATLAPSGSVTADKLVEDSATSAHNASQNIVVLISTAYTFSIYAKAAERTSLQIRLTSGTVIPTAQSLIFNLSNGTISAGTGTPTGTITNVGNNWYRCTLTISTTIAAGSLTVAFRLYNGSDIYTGDGVSGMFLWGSQYEAGAFATSYIPTVASQVTRTADIAVMTGTNFSDWYNASEGTFVCKASIPYTAAGNRGPWRVDDNSDTNRMMVRNAGGSTDFRVITAGSSVVSLQNAITANTVFQHAAAYKNDNYAAALNGAGFATDTAGTVPTVITMRIGDPVALTTLMGCTVARIYYYPQRLTDNEVTAFSKQ
jgi:hypothetical protein